MITTQQINELLGITESYKAPERLLKILYNKQEREKLFKEFLKLENDLSFEWFQQYFENEHADRKQKKQDFTPTAIADLLNKLTKSEVSDNGLRFDCCSGTGAITISRWWEDCLNDGVIKYKPSKYLYYCEEITDRAIPFLLFNLAIRGMNAVVIQCDSLTRKAKGAFFIHNIDDDYLHFSNINRLPYSEKDINLVHNQITISKTIQRICDKATGQSYLKIGTGKTINSMRTVPIVAQLRLFLKKQMKGKPEEFYLVTDSDKPCEPRNLRKIYETMLKHAGVRQLKFHGLRHSFATRLLSKGVDVKTVSSILGHSKVQTTMDLYVHPSKQQQMNAINKAFNKI